MGGLVIDLFAGPGGWDVGARELGIEPVGVEWDKWACATAMQAGFVRFQRDVSELDPSDFLDYLDEGPLWGLIGSPPCQGFSIAGKGRGRAGKAVILEGVARIAAGEDPKLVCKEVDDALDDRRAALVLEPLRWALELEPEWIALEQVPPVLPLWEAMAEVLRQDGWNTDTGLLTSEQYDVPQTRKRAFLIAHRERAVQLPAPIRRKYRKGAAQHDGDPQLLPWLSMADALGWGMTQRPSMTATAGGTTTGGAEVFGNGARTSMRRELDAGRWTVRSSMGTPKVDGRNGSHEFDPEERPAHTVTTKVGEWQLAPAAATRPTDGTLPRRVEDEPALTVTFGHNAANWVWQQRDAHVAADAPPRTTVLRGSNQANASKRAIEEPSGTLHFSERSNKVEFMDAADAPDPKKSGVRVTVEEAAVLQGFPADYPWQGAKTVQYRQVGDAVPPPLAWHVLRAATGVA